MKKLAQKFTATLFAVSLAWAGLAADSAFASNGKRILPRHGSISIAKNSGGQIVRFALQAARLKRSKTTVRFTGQCDSACTLLLALPRSQTCVAPGASFRFHAPMARSSRAALLAHTYMMRKYPGWVRSYIRNNGGLGKRLVKMDHGYASKFMRSCVTRVATRSQPRSARHLSAI